MELDAVQRRLIRSKITPYSILRGVPGCGKTTAAVYRIIYLKNNYCLYEQDKILIITHNEEKLSKFKHLYKTLDESSRLDFITLFSNQEDKLYLFTIDNIINKYFLEFKKDNNLNCEVINNKYKRHLVIEHGIDINKTIYSDVRIMNKKHTDFFIDEIKWMKSCNYVELNDYQNADRIGRKCKKGFGPQRLLKNSREREAIFNLMLLYNESLRKNNLIDNEDKALLALKQIESGSSNKYTHIVINESHKLTKVQLDFINKLKNYSPYSSVMLIIDQEESTGSNAWLIRGRKISTLELECKPRSYCFKKNYKEVSESIEKVDDHVEQEYAPSIEMFKYHDLRHNKSFEFIRDVNNISDIVLTDEYGGDEYTKEELKELFVYSNIAAGEPILMNPEIEENFYIPQYWLKGMKDCFILKVKGESMINADINDGDYVIIRKQSSAQSNDIVAVDLDGSATLKRLKIRKNDIMLMPENEKYKPILIGEEGVRIIGTAVGILKKN